MLLKETSTQVRINKAIMWLEAVTQPDGGIHRYINCENGEFGTISTEITGYAAHLFSWLYLVTKKVDYKVKAKLYADWLVRLWEANHIFLPFEPESKLSYFFDTGIAARGLLLTAEALRDTKYYEVAKSITTFMKSFYKDATYTPIVDKEFNYAGPSVKRWSSSPGVCQLKPALAFKFLDEDWGWEEFPKIFTFSGDGYTDGDLLHPLAYFVEGLAMLGFTERALFWEDMLNAELRSQRIKSSKKHIKGLWRTDALAQSIRLKIFLNIPLKDDMQYLKLFQSVTGGFWFGRKSNTTVPFLSTHVTIFAIQAMLMEELPNIVDFQELTLV